MVGGSEQPQGRKRKAKASKNKRGTVSHKYWCVVIASHEVLVFRFLPILPEGQPRRLVRKVDYVVQKFVGATSRGPFSCVKISPWLASLRINNVCFSPQLYRGKGGGIFRGCALSNSSRESLLPKAEERREGRVGKGCQN